jgi:hypothetical protein
MALTRNDYTKLRELMPWVARIEVHWKQEAGEIEEGELDTDLDGSEPVRVQRARGRTEDELVTVTVTSKKGEEHEVDLSAVELTVAGIYTAVARQVDLGMWPDALKQGFKPPHEMKAELPLMFGGNALPPKAGPVNQSDLDETEDEFDAALRGLEGR